MTKADKRRADIARSAAVLFEREGFHNVNVGDLAEAVNLSKATLYHYVQSKAEIVAWIHDELIEGLLERLERHVNDGTDPRVALKQVVVDTLRITDARPGYLRVFLEYQREIPEGLRARAIARRRRFEGLVVVLVERGIAEGLLRAPHPHLTAMALLSITNWSYQWYRPGETSPDEAAEHMFDIFLNGAGGERGVTLPRIEPTPRPDKTERTDISDAAWEVVRPLLLETGRRGRQWRDHRQVLNAIAWKLETGAAWPELPDRFGPWRTIYARYLRWRRDGTWRRLIDLAHTQEPEVAADLAWLLMPDRDTSPEP